MLTGSIVPCWRIRRRWLEGLVEPALSGRYRQSLELPCRRRPPPGLGATAPPRRLLRSLPAARAAHGASGDQERALREAHPVAVDHLRAGSLKVGRRTE